MKKKVAIKPFISQRFKVEIRTAGASFCGLGIVGMMAAKATSGSAEEASLINRSAPEEVVGVEMPPIHVVRLGGGDVGRSWTTCPARPLEIQVE